MISSTDGSDSSGSSGPSPNARSAIRATSSARRSSLSTPASRSTSARMRPGRSPESSDPAPASRRSRRSVARVSSRSMPYIGARVRTSPPATRSLSERSARAGLRVVRLGLRPCVLQPVEVAPADVGLPHQGERRLHALLQRGERVDPRVDDDLRRHVGRRVQGVGDHARLREVERMHDLGELALAIRAVAAVAAGQHRVVEVDRRLTGAGHVDDVRGSQLAREQVAGQVVDLEASTRGRPRSPRGRRSRSPRC